MVNGYAICLKEWILDREIRNELPLLLLISNLCAKIGYCYASNKYFADILELDECVISKKIKKLVDKGYIFTEYKKRGCEVLERKLRLSKITTDDCQKNQSTIVKKDKENNISINNNIYKNIYTEKKELSKYGEFKNVCLEEEYYQKLKTSLGEKKLNYAIEKLDAWLDNPKQKSKRNANHRAYFKSNSWVWEGFVEENNPYSSFTAGFSKNATVKPHEDDLSWMED